MTDARQLHLPNLSIRGFRGIDALSIPRLGRVTLLAGMNSVGKTTVLDAVAVYASRGRSLSSLLWDREEVYTTVDEDGDSVLRPDWGALFYGRNMSQEARISIGSDYDEDLLTIELGIPDDQQARLQGFPVDAPIQVLKATYRETTQALTWTILNELATHLVPQTTRRQARRRDMRRLLGEDEPLPAMKCESQGPGLLNNIDLARLWDGVVLTDDQERAVDALRPVFGSGIDAVAVVGDDRPIGRRVGRRAMVRLRGHRNPVPLRSLGDGALRLFGVALALANSRDGFLLIDEAENGIHYSVQRDYWRMVLRAAHEDNVQVFATTHSSDCIRGVAEAASEIEEAEGVLVRLSRRDGELRAVEYREEELVIAAEQGIEVR